MEWQTGLLVIIYKDYFYFVPTYKDQLKLAIIYMDWNEGSP